MSPIDVNILCLGRHMKMKLKDAGHVMEKHVEVLFVLVQNPRVDFGVHVFQKCNMTLSKVANSGKARILENDKVSGVVAVVLICAKGPLFSLHENLLFFCTIRIVDDVKDPLGVRCSTLFVYKILKSGPVVHIWAANDVLHDAEVAYTQTCTCYVSYPSCDVRPCEILFCSAWYI